MADTTEENKERNEMDKEVFLLVDGDRFYIGKVKELLTIDEDCIDLREVVAGIVEDLVFTDESSEYKVCSIEVQ